MNNLKCHLALVVLIVSMTSLTLFAQSVSLTGTVKDESGAVIPGVTVTAVSGGTGRSHAGVSNETGSYLISGLDPGTYNLRAELPGFATTVQSNITFLVGQSAKIDFTMKPAALAEEVTVVGESPLIEVTNSQLGGNVDPRQFADLPLNGRNWMDLALLVPGVMKMDPGNNPISTGGTDGKFQLNVDGQQVTQETAGTGFGQPRFSRDSIAEFQLITNRFDVTQGRSAMMQVNAVSRAGSNELHGSFYGFFRDDKFNAADKFAGRVLPYENQQIGGSIGGPVLRNRSHFFVSAEYEREPSTIFTVPNGFSGLNFSFPTKRTEQSYLARADHQIGNRNHLSVRLSLWDWKNPFTAVNSTQHPSIAAERTQSSWAFIGNWSRTIGNSTVNELRAGYNYFEWENLPIVKTRRYDFPGFSLGAPQNYPQIFFQDVPSVRDDLAFMKQWHGQHNIKLGGEYLHTYHSGYWQHLGRGTMNFSRDPDRIPERFKVWNDPSTWDFSGLDSIANVMFQNFANPKLGKATGRIKKRGFPDGGFNVDIPRPTIAFWYQDNWALTKTLTLNFGVRYDNDIGVLDPPDTPKEFPYTPGIRDNNNIAPRFGFSWDVSGNAKTVIRGGSGIFYGTATSNVSFGHQLFNGVRVLVNSKDNDGRPGFVADPWRGATADDFVSGRVPLPTQAPRVIAADARIPWNWQSSLGFAREIASNTAVDVDLNHWTMYDQWQGVNFNLFYDPATGHNLSPLRSGRPFSNFTQILYMTNGGRQTATTLLVGLRRRYANRWQGQVSYTLGIRERNNSEGWGIEHSNFFNRRDEWATATGFQRNTLRLNGIVDLPWQFEVSAIYHYGSGRYSATTAGGDPFVAGGTNRRLGSNVTVPIPAAASLTDGFQRIIPADRVLPVGTIIPKNAMIGTPIHRVDLRISKAFNLATERVKLNGVFEVFNLFNHTNWDTFEGRVNNRRFGLPTGAFPARQLQLAFRLTF